MSNPILDYLPCDLTRYSQEILPAWHAARQGRFEPLRALMASARHISYWPVFNIPNPLPDLFFAGPKSYFGWDYFEKDQPFWPQFFDACRFVPTMLEPLPENFVVDFDNKEILDFWNRRFLPELRETLPQEFFTTTELDFWALCSRHLPTLFGANASTNPQTFLLGCLLYTFCCQLPSEVMADCREIGNEDAHLWEEYMARTTQIEAFWGRFREPASQALADQLLFPQTYQEYLALLAQDQKHDRTQRFQRAIIDIGHDINGFLDHDETVYLLTHLPINERPDLAFIIEGCIRDREKEKWPLSPELEQLWGRLNYTYPEHDSNMYELSISSDREAFRTYMRKYMAMQQKHYEEFRQNNITDEQQIQKIYRAFCAYWNETYPQEFQKNANRYYQSIERMEKEMLSRFRYAVDHGWGMIMVEA